jgi:hypothetical protein
LSFLRLHRSLRSPEHARLAQPRLLYRVPSGPTRERYRVRDCWNAHQARCRQGPHLLPTRSRNRPSASWSRLSRHHLPGLDAGGGSRKPVAGVGEWSGRCVAGLRGRSERRRERLERRRSDRIKPMGVGDGSDGVSSAATGHPSAVRSAIRPAASATGVRPIPSRLRSTASTQPRLQLSSPLTTGRRLLCCRHRRIALRLASRPARCALALDPVSSGEQDGRSVILRERTDVEPEGRIPVFAGEPSSGRRRMGCE